MKIAIGPARDFPSWHWCGGDLVPGLKSVHDVAIFRQYADLSSGRFESVVIVKKPPSGMASSHHRSLAGGVRIVYIPVDFFKTETQIEQHSQFLRSCDVVATHCSRLDGYLLPHCRRLAHVEHYGKHVLPAMADYRPEGFVLWTGQGTHARHAYGWYTKMVRDFRLVILSNALDFATWDANPGVRCIPWSEEEHLLLLGEAKAGLDIKGGDFGQMTKPPTKAQQFVASGVPTAVNRESYSWEWFHGRGFDLADPDDGERWFSRRYWEETREFGLSLREEISKERVAASYLDLLRDMTADNPKGMRDDTVHF
jgi:hypothetical protein